MSFLLLLFMQHFQINNASRDYFTYIDLNIVFLSYTKAKKNTTLTYLMALVTTKLHMIVMRKYIHDLKKIVSLHFRPHGL